MHWHSIQAVFQETVVCPNTNLLSECAQVNMIILMTEIYTYTLQFCLAHWNNYTISVEWSETDLKILTNYWDLEKDRKRDGQKVMVPA